MDALVYEDSPLAEYLDSEGIPLETSNLDASDSDQASPRTTKPDRCFAPTGLPNITSRLRQLRRSANQLQLETSEQILEQFRYIIVASQLLSDEAPPRPVTNNSQDADRGLLWGAVATASLSFITAWTLHWLRSRRTAFHNLTIYELCIYCLGSFCVGVAILLFARRQYSKYVQKSAATSLTSLVNESQAFDTSAGRVLRFIQEIELVARGYELSTPLPPVTRLDDRSAIKRCQSLRLDLVRTLTVLITLYVNGHNIMQRYVVPQDLDRYHDIYEISLTEYSDAIKVANAATEDDKCALKELRFALRLHAVARKVFLCDLMALRTTIGWHRVRQWRAVLLMLRNIEEETVVYQRSLDNVLRSLEFGSEMEHLRAHRRSSALSAGSEDSLQESEHHKMQIRRLDDITHSIRALNAKVHVVREEVSGLKSAHTEESVISAALAKHYEALGTDIRALQTEWERGKNALLLSVNTDHLSRPGSLSPRTPMSLSPSLGGFAVVDGGPAEALRLLTGEQRSSRSSDGTLYDEEVFEAISKPTPRKRMSLGAGMTREEKIARLNEDRKKRATLAEQADTTNNMLRELQMVIKHRPNARTPTTPTGSRVASL